MDEYYPMFDIPKNNPKRCCHKPCLTPTCILDRYTYIACCYTCNSYVIKERNHDNLDKKMGIDF